ncbi:hypothetical protein GSI_08413 [Ganoderma sinense ZZ0214-1]|uniref:Ribosomal RNA methyltransferase FtsJ domain-containing protein n=1 Tax=Ganoderma sinense ZZ0214-1 TaxID=1077348 RepID=A0A2G8S6T1_9APHY|nr:hypothetical protein GSI_08413 [Ganoderma sinense ZZ0214-1]
MSRSLAYEYTAPPLDANSAALTVLERRHVPELAELDQLRRKGWRDEGLDGHFRTQRKVADQSTHASEVFWFEMMKKGMKEMDDAVGILPSQGMPFEFLDVCCCPGGFSSFTLNKRRSARGVGISLPVSSGGHSFMLEDYLRPRYRFIEKDILEYNLAPSGVSGMPHSPDRLPDSMLERFQLVIIDGHALRTYAYASPGQPSLNDAKEAHILYRDSLHIAQLIVALECVRPGGTIMMRLSHVEAFPAAHFLYLLDKLSDELTVYKPRSMHAYRGTFYVVAKGICRRTPTLLELKARYVAGLRQLWFALRCGGPDGRGRRMSCSDLDFIVSTEEILGGYLDRLIELGRPVWRTQAEGLHGFFAKKGIK